MRLSKMQVNVFQNGFRGFSPLTLTKHVKISCSQKKETKEKVKKDKIKMFENVESGAEAFHQLVTVSTYTFVNLSFHQLGLIS